MIGIRYKIKHSCPTLGEEEQEAVAKVIESGHIAMGEKVEEFEDALKKFVGRKHAIAVSSGTAALHLALLALKVDRRKNVMVMSEFCESVLQAIFHAGGIPLVCEYYFDSKDCRDYVIIAQNSLNKQRIGASLLTFNNALLIEDFTQTIGSVAEEDGRKSGTYGHISVCSFYATKLLTTGEGGVVFTDDDDVAEFVRSKRRYRKRERFSIRYNYEMTDIAAAMGIVQLKKLPSFLEKRKELWQKYFTLCGDIEEVFLVPSNYGYFKFYLGLTTIKTSLFIEAMEKLGVQCGRPFPRPLHRLMGYSDNGFEETSFVSDRLISFPLYPSLTHEEISYIVNCLKEVVKQFSPIVQANEKLLVRQARFLKTRRGEKDDCNPPA